MKGTIQRACRASQLHRVFRTARARSGSVLRRAQGASRSTNTLANVVLLSTTVFAQHVAVVPGFGIEAGIGYYPLSGDDFDLTDPGIGFEGEARYTWASGFQLAGGVSYNIHGVDVDVIDENLKVLGVFAEPRYLFALKSPNIAPFIGGRLSYLHQSLDRNGVSTGGNGWAFGGVGGLLFQVGQQVGIEVSVLFAAVSFGDFEADGFSIANTDTSGSTLGLRAGVVVNFPR